MRRFGNYTKYDNLMGSPEIYDGGKYMPITATYEYKNKDGMIVKKDFNIGKGTPNEVYDWFINKDKEWESKGWYSKLYDAGYKETLILVRKKGEEYRVLFSIKLHHFTLWYSNYKNYQQFYKDSYPY